LCFGWVFKSPQTKKNIIRIEDSNSINKNLQIAKKKEEEEEEEEGDNKCTDFDLSNIKKEGASSKKIKLSKKTVSKKSEDEAKSERKGKKQRTNSIKKEDKD
jgi:hypothetical protein